MIVIAVSLETEIQDTLIKESFLQIFCAYKQIVWWNINKNKPKVMHTIFEIVFEPEVTLNLEYKSYCKSVFI